MMLQRWHEISFFHWSCNPEHVRRRIPQQLQVDTYEGKAWISLTPFLLTGLRPKLFPHSLSLAFPETNLRTYVIGPNGPAVWFFSLDCSRLLVVLGASASFGLPYFWTNMHVDIGLTENFYFSDRGGRARARIRIVKEPRIAEQSPLDLFLTARFRLYSIFRGRLITAEVEHPPWELNRVRVIEFEENIRHVMVVEFPSADFITHYSLGVDAKIGIPRRVVENS